MLQRVEIMTFYQIPHFSIIGLPGPEIRESTDRIRAALLSEGFEIPKRKVVINLSPAGLRKQGTATDLAIALTIIFQGKIKHTHRIPLRPILAAGELGLQGALTRSHSVFRTLVAAESHGITDILLAPEDAELAESYRRKFYHLFSAPLRIHAASSLRSAFDTLAGKRKSAALPLRVDESTTFNPSASRPLPIASPSHRRVLSAVSAGLHHVLLLGPKGIGKTRSTDWIKTLRAEDFLRSTRQQLCMHELLYPQADLTEQNTALPVRYASPHLKPAALMGGAHGGHWIPGELQLANHGIFIADEFTEWSRDSREALRGPLESFTLHVSAVQFRKTFDCRFQLVATSNLCPCGGLPKSLAHRRFSVCRCSPGILMRYLNKLSGPILDRIDFCALLQNENQPAEKSIANARVFCDADAWIAQIREARRILGKRDNSLYPGQWTAAQTESWISELEQRVQLREPLAQIYREENARSRHKIIRMATTLAALDGHELPGAQHLWEAKLYRPEAIMSALIPASTFPLVRD